jgi:hypothetical protein
VAQHAWHCGVMDQCRWPVCHPWLVLPVPRVVGWHECPAPGGTASRTAPFRRSPAWGTPATHCFGVAGRGSTARRTTRRVRLVAVAVVARAHKVSRGLAGWVSVFRTSLPSKLMKAVKVLGLAVFGNTSFITRFARFTVSGKLEWYSQKGGLNGDILTLVRVRLGGRLTGTGASSDSATHVQVLQVGQLCEGSTGASPTLHRMLAARAHC